VDAYPGETFAGEVGKIRLNASMTQNVVTYTVEVITDNSNGKLLPYLTANAKFLVGERRGVLIVPNAALRYTPSPDLVMPESRGALESKPVEEPRRSSERPDKKSPATEEGPPRGTVWIPEGSLLRSVSVIVGFTDGSMTEVQSDELKEGAPVVVGENLPGDDNRPSGGSPFIPQFRRSRGSSGH